MTVKEEALKKSWKDAVFFLEKDGGSQRKHEVHRGSWCKIG